MGDIASFLVTAVVIFLLIMINVWHREYRIDFDCTNHGKTMIQDKWYECKPIGN